MIVFFTKYTSVGASSRYRSYQYLPILRDSGFTIKVKPLFNDAYLAYKYTHGRNHLGFVLLALWRRVWAVLMLPRDSVVWVEYELLPYCPAWLERWLVWRGCRLVVDYDDALFHQYDEHSNSLVRRLLSQKIAILMRISHTVVVGNEYLASYAFRANAPHIVIIPTVIDLNRYLIKPSVIADDVCTIGWIGSPSTACYMHDIAPALAKLWQDRNIRICMVGSGTTILPGVPVEFITWNEDSEVDEIRRFDIGVMPLPDEPWARGKCGFKLIQYMACGLPVIASPVGVNTKIVHNGENGLLADSNMAWISALYLLVDDVALRKSMGAKGRQLVEQSYCLAVTAPMLIEVLQRARADVSYNNMEI